MQVGTSNKVGAKLKLSVLTDDTADRSFPAIRPEHGVCYHIDLGTTKVLFDLGYSGVFIENAALLGIDLKQVTHLCLSHGHNDHAGGLLPWIRSYEKDLSLRRPCLISHKNVFNRKLKEDPHEVETGMGIDKNFIETFFHLNLTNEPFSITDDLIFLGQIDRTNDFENKNPVGKTFDVSGKLIDDFCLDDSALIYRTEKGIVLITACSHSGICNIIKYAEKIAKEKWEQAPHITTVIGGLHLKGNETDLLKKTAEFFKTKNIEKFYIGHCTEFKAKAYLLNLGFNIDELHVGREISF